MIGMTFAEIVFVAKSLVLFFQIHKPKLQTPGRTTLLSNFGTA